MFLLPRPVIWQMKGIAIETTPCRVGVAAHPVAHESDRHGQVMQRSLDELDDMRQPEGDCRMDIGFCGGDRSAMQRRCRRRPVSRLKGLGRRSCGPASLASYAVDPWVTEGCCRFPELLGTMSVPAR